MYDRDPTIGAVDHWWRTTSGPSVRGSTCSTAAVGTSDLKENTHPTPSVITAAPSHTSVMKMSPSCEPPMNTACYDAGHDPGQGGHSRGQDLEGGVDIGQVVH